MKNTNDELEQAMKFDLLSMVNSRFGIAIALGLGRLIPNRVGYRLASYVAGQISAQRDAEMVQATRANQWVVSGCKLSPDQLDQAVIATFNHTAHCLYDLYHNLSDQRAIQRIVQYGSSIDYWIKKSREGKEGFVFVSPHLSNFDLAGRLVAMRGLEGIVLSFPNPRGDYQWQNRLRKSAGFRVVPISGESLRDSILHVKNGGAVLTGLDRPIPESKYCPKFFGRPAPLPTLHVRLALRTGVPVVVVACLMRQDGVYCIEAADPIWMQKYTDPKQEILLNAERVLQQVETFICRAPHQWAMFYPVWPEALEEANKRV